MRIARILVAALAALSAVGCSSQQPRIGSTFPLHAELTVEEALWAKNHWPALEDKIVREIETIDAGELYRSTVIERGMESAIPYQQLSESLQMHVTRVEIRYFDEQPVAWMWVTVSTRRLGESKLLKDTDPQVVAWNAFSDEFKKRMDWAQDVMASVLRKGPHWHLENQPRGPS